MFVRDSTSPGGSLGTRVRAKGKTPNLARIAEDWMGLRGSRCPGRLRAALDGSSLSVGPHGASVTSGRVGACGN